MLRLASITLGALLLALGPASGQAGPKDAGKVDFTRDIRPILANNCLLCHGPDAKARKADLRLDSRDSAMADLGEGVRAIVPGQPAKSALYQRITAADPEDVMPPAKTGKKLTKVQVDLLKRWIEEGAPYAKHWSFARPERPAPPAVKDAKWARNDVDRFILARLEREGLKPSPEADRHALARRLSLDLTGLPPAIEDVDRFVNDKAPDAYETCVDRLLASPAYGERWGRVWLDLARYADSQGYTEDRPRVIWAFRDWVIRALNENMPFDRFTIEQLAGDLLPNATDSQVQATGFHRNTLTQTEGGTDDEEFRNFAIIDRVNTTMAVWMGVSFNCAQCHDHKFDPFSQEEFFRLFAFFNQTEDNDQPDDKPLLMMFSEEQKKQKQGWLDEIARLETVLAQPSPELEAGRKKWEEGFRKPVAWTALRPAELKSASGAALALQGDASILASGGTPAKDTYTLHVTTDAKSIAALRLEALPDPSLPASGPGRGAKGDFLLSRVAVSLVPKDGKSLEARFVRVELPGQPYLSLAEVQVLSGGANVALKGKASQSSTGFEGVASRAIDGVTNGDYHAANSVTHTAGGEDNPWWEVDLGKPVPIERIVIWNRTDGGTSERLKGFRVKLLDKDRKGVDERKFDKAPNPKVEWPVDGTRAIALRSAHGEGGAAALVANADPKTQGWSGAAGKPHEAVIILEKPLALEAGTVLGLTLEHASGAALGRFRVSATADPAAQADLPADVQAILGKAERSKDEAAKVETYYRSIAPERATERARLAQVRKDLEGQKAAMTVPVLRELPAARRRKTQIQVRGNFLVKEKEVSEGVPAVFHPMPEGEPKSRLALAKWLVHPDNPLTARVVVNRHWEQLFGTGLVSTSEDFGVRGESPSHPELLDWLATELVREKWDLKKLLKLLVTSATYRQGSNLTPELVGKDPANRLLARGPRFRLSAEAVRDQALAAGGLLSRKMFGPSVYPPQPRIGLSAAFSGSLDWQTSTGEDKYRRGLYIFWRRSVTYPSMATFDAPDGNVCSVRRIPTNTPLQALVTLNDPVYVEAAQGLARKIVAEGGASTRERAGYAVRRCLSRPARDIELDRLTALVEEARGRYAKDAAKAKSMATEPLGPVPAGADLAELAAWTVAGNVLLNLDEMFLKR